MKQLLLLRHAKAARHCSSGRDEDRPLNDRGVDDAPLVGRFLRKLDCVPDRILSSPSVRTRQTTELVLEKLKSDVEPEFLEEMYLADARSLWKLVCGQATGDRLMLIGHNPGMESLLALACGGEARLQMPTCAVACIDLAADAWKEAGVRGGSLAWLLTPHVLHALK